MEQEYHNTCSECGNTFWTNYAFNKLCPECHEYLANRAWDLIDE